MTLTQIRLLTRKMLFSVAKNADVDQGTLDLLLDSINKSFWLRAVKAAQTMFTVWSDVTVTVNADGKYDLSQVSAFGFYRVVRIELFTTTGNRVPLDPIYVNDRQEFELPSIVATSLDPSAWYTLRGGSYNAEELYLVPKPSRDVKLRIFYVPNIPDWVDNAEAMGGVAAFSTMHALIAAEAALALGAVNVTALRDRLESSFNDTIRKRHGQGARKAHYEPYE